MYLRRFIRTWGPALLLMLAIFCFSSIPSETMPRFGDFDLSVKKGGHMLGYAILAVTYWHALGRQHPKTWLFAWLLTIAYAMTDEFHQSFVPGRSARWFDVGIDATGAMIGLLAFGWFTRSAWHRRTSKTDNPPQSPPHTP